MSPGYRGKRALDLAISVPALVASLPIQAAIALAVRRRLGTPVLFRQTRPGLHGEPFELVKFRSMRDIDEAAGLVTDAQRLTAFGVWLRSTSLDELPSLWNVVKGDMSIVGPRPLLMRYLPRYTREQARRHDVRPGMTGLAQVSGRNALTWEQKFALDTKYVEQMDLKLDARIVLTTVLQVLKRTGINADDDAPMAEFVGTGKTPT